MAKTVAELQKLIKPIPEEMLIALPDNEQAIFKLYKLFPVDLLVKAEWNYKDDDDVMSEYLLNNIKRNGQIMNCNVRLLSTGYYEVVDGNHRLDTFKKLKQQYVLAYDHGNISKEEAIRKSLELNETRFKSNNEKLQSVLAQIAEAFDQDDLESTIPYPDLDFADFYADTLPDINPSEVEEDNYENIEVVEPVTVRGDIYELNGHRVLCGDSTSKSDLAKLMNGNKAHMLYTDPPYNISYPEFNKNRGSNGKDWGDSYCSEWDDKMSDEDYKEFLYKFLKNAKENLIEWAHYYVWHATVYLFELMEAFNRNEIPYDKLPIQWVKQVAPPSHVRYWRCTEPCLYGGKGAINGNGSGARWFGAIGEKNAWLIDREHNGNYIHPTQKPVALAVKAINNSSQKGEIVLETFLGSGSTLIGCDVTGRICYGMEYEPKYCDVIVLRYFKFCKDNNIDCVVKHNGEVITESFFNYSSEIKTKDTYEQIESRNR